MSTTVETPYIRPNLDNQGEVPPVGEIIYSPDVCFAGIHPIGNFQEALKQPESYAQAIENEAFSNMDNYVYLRCKNGATKSVTIQAQLFAVPKNKSMFPDAWVPLSVDSQEEKEGNITNVIPAMQPGEIGVTEAPFIWKSPDTESYSLIARLFSDEFPNDMPQSSDLKPVYIADLLKDGLLWAQRNIAEVKFNPNQPYMKKDISLNIPTDSMYQKSKWLILLKSHKFDTWDIQIQASRTDEEGTEIAMERRRMEEQAILGTYVMSPGFYSRVSIMLYPTTVDVTVADDAYVNLELYYGIPTADKEATEKVTPTVIRVLDASDFKKH